MKRLLFVATTVVAMAFSSFSQNSKGFSFQGIARDVNGAALGATDIQLRVTLLDANKVEQYKEEHQLTTDAFGVFTVVIGSANPVAFANVDFGISLTAKIELAKKGGIYAELANYELQAVPYAKHAEIADVALNGSPTGTIVAYGGTTVPAGWLLCDGTQYSGTEALYKNLYEAIEINWGGNSTTKQFNVPDLRGLFLRGVTGASANDADAASRTAQTTGGNTGNEVGSMQTDEVKSHNHGSGGKTTVGFAVIGPVTSYGPFANPGSTDATGGSETRPKNAYVYYIIKL